ncbi:hypothetical protein D3C87_1329660 [compost metagenome]
MPRVNAQAFPRAIAGPSQSAIVINSNDLSRGIDVADLEDHAILEMLGKQPFLEHNRASSGQVIDNVMRVDIHIWIAGSKVQDTL